MDIYHKGFVYIVNKLRLDEFISSKMSKAMNQSVTFTDEKIAKSYLSKWVKDTELRLRDSIEEWNVWTNIKWDNNHTYCKLKYRINKKDGTTIQKGEFQFYIVNAELRVNDVFDNEDNDENEFIDVLTNDAYFPMGVTSGEYDEFYKPQFN